MRIIHSRGFPEEERHQTRAVIYSNVVIAFKVLLDIMKAEKIDFEHEKTQVQSSLPPDLKIHALTVPQGCWRFVRQDRARRRLRRGLLGFDSPRCDEGHVA
jgi:hypothetical protein